jgi:hypothetical protein
MRPCICLVVALALGASLAQADEPRLLFAGHRRALPRLGEGWQKRCWCPDDYDRKILPTIPCNAKGCGDDYCRKTFPRVPCNPKGCGDDYCPKSLPLSLGNLCEPWYRCGPAAGGTGSCVLQGERNGRLHFMGSD